MKSKNNIKIFMTMILFVIFAISCGENKTSKVDTKKDEIVFANFRDIRDLNPHNYSGEMYAQNIIFEGLVKISVDGDIVPSLAEKWEISNDGKEYTFYLRKNVVFSDDEPFNAQAVKMNFDAILANKERHGWLESLQMFEKLEIIDEYTVKIVLEKPYFPFLIELGLVRPLRMISPKGMKNGGTKEGIVAPIGTGPYVLKENVKDQEAIFERNEKYWGKKPEIKTLRVKVIPEEDTRTLSLEKGELDILFGKNMISAETIKKFSSMKGFETAISEPLSTRMLVVNSTKGALQDKNVRKALQHVLDKKVISDAIFEGTELPADRLLDKTVKYMDVDVPIYEYSLEKAGQLLDEAGWKLSSNGMREKDGKPLVIGLNYNNSSVSEKTISEYFNQELKKIGVNLVINGDEEQSFRDKLKAGDFEISFNIVWGKPYDPQAFFSSMRIPAIYGDWAAQQGIPDKKEIDEKIYNAMITTDEVEREKLFKEVLVRLTDEAIYIPLTYEVNRTIYNSALKNVGFEISAYEIPFYNMNY